MLDEQIKSILEQEEAAGMSHREIGKRHHVSQTHITHLLNGQRPVSGLTIETVQKMFPLASFNLNGDGGDTDGDGILIRKALELCATLEDFERLLDTVKKPREVNSNFAVLDANGGCAYYETGNYEYVKFDVNDPNVAPDGYLMRTNFGTTGNHKLDMGVERYCAITDFMAEACKEGNLEHDYLITSI